ncbi:tetratricopeptide repeat protein [bacterium]|nr:tetratricopeptide repeat protein [bacterium]
MRTFLVITALGMLLCGTGGCSTQRMQLSKNEPPKNVPEERVKYGNPWSKKKPADEKVASSNDLTAELAEQMAQAKSTMKDKSSGSTEILKRAAAAEARGDLDDARAAYLEVVSIDPNNSEAHHRLGVISDMNGDAQTADEHYGRAYAANPKDADLLSDMGYSYYLRGRFDAAERKLKEALEYHPYHRSAQNNLALVYGKQGNYDGALAMFRQTGTESEAQKNIRTLFPNGRPSGDTTAIAQNDLPVNPLPLTPTTPGQAPPFPADFDVANMNSGASQPGSMMQPATNGAAGTGSNTFASMWSNGTPTGPAGQPMASGNSAPWGTPANSPANTGMSVAAKPQENVEFWKGNLGQNPPATPQPVAPTGTAMAPWSNFPGAPPLPGQAQPVPNAMAANNGLPAGWPSSNMNPGMQPPNPFANNGTQEIQPAGHQDWAVGSNSAPMNNPAASNGQPLDPAQATRWAAQMGLGTGPGSMFPTMNTQNPSAPAWNQPNSTMSTGNPSPTQWAYAEVPAGNVPVTNANLNTSWSTETTNPAAMPAWGNSGPMNGSNASSPIAPPSPWNDVPENSSAWDQPWGQGPTNAPASGNMPASTVPPATFAAVPNWPGSQDPNAVPGNRSNSGTPTDWPVINPGASAVNVPYTNSPAPSNMMVPASPATMNNGSTGTTSVPNWPYAPSRP